MRLKLTLAAGVLGLAALLALDLAPASAPAGRARGLACRAGSHAAARPRGEAARDSAGSGGRSHAGADARSSVPQRPGARAPITAGGTRPALL